ncbi:MAG: ATP-binding protein, partial [Pseudomonas sp.]|nr:ATP-binding protein [Pseudomonas sp.]
QRRVTAAIAAVERGAKLSSQLLAFARRQPLSPAVYNPQRIYAGLGELLQRALGETIHIDVQLPQDSWCINVDRNQLENALLNLAINARDAMQGEGVIRITGDNIILNPDDCAGKSVLPGEYVRLAVTDIGVGMSSAVLARVFEPFFTTKREGHGTGLGLSMVFGFVRQSGGHVEVWSEEGKGTVVQMYFPRSLGAEDPDSHPVEAVPHAGGQETILVVEDNVDVRVTVVELLEQSGYTVLTAEDGDRAMQALQGGVQPDLIFTDVVMPGRVKSTDLADWARAQVPPVAVLFTSGHTRDILSSNHLLSPDIHLLSKPYSPESLTQRVRSVLTVR